MNSSKEKSFQGFRFWTTFSVITTLAFGSISISLARKTQDASSQRVTSAVIEPCTPIEPLYLSAASESWIENCSRRSTNFFEYKVSFGGKSPILLEIETSGSLIVEVGFAGEPLKQVFESGQIDENINVKMKRQLKIDGEPLPPLRVRFSKKKGSSKPFALWKMFVRRGAEIYPGTATEQAFLDNPGASILPPGGGRKIPEASSVSYKLQGPCPFAVVLEAEGEFTAGVVTGTKMAELPLQKKNEVFFGVGATLDESSIIVIRSVTDVKLIRISLWFGLSAVAPNSEIGKLILPIEPDEVGVPFGAEPLAINLPPHANGYFWCTGTDPNSLSLEGLESTVFKGLALVAKLPPAESAVKIKGNGRLALWGIDDDADQDFIPSTLEMAYGTDPDRQYTDFDDSIDSIDPMPLDSDNDGLDDKAEDFLVANSSNVDTNLDGHPDGLGLGTPRFANFCARTGENPWPGAAHQDVLSKEHVWTCQKFGDTSLVVPFGQILLSREPEKELVPYFEGLAGANGVLLDYCAIRIADLEKPEMIDAFQVFAKRLWGSLSSDNNLAYQAGLFCCDRIKTLIAKTYEIAKEKNLKVAISCPSPFSPDRVIAPYTDFGLVDRIVVNPPAFSSDQSAYFAGFRDAKMIGKPVWVGIEDEEGIRGYISGVIAAGLYAGTSVSNTRPLVVTAPPKETSTTLVQITLDCTIWSPLLDLENPQTDWISSLGVNNILMTPATMSEFHKAKFAFIDESTTFPSEEQELEIEDWISEGGVLMVRQGTSRYKGEVWWGSRTTLGRKIARSFNIYEAQQSKVYDAGKGKLFLYDGEVGSGLAMLFNEIHEDLPKPACSFCELTTDSVEPSFLTQYVEKIGEFPRAEYPVFAEIVQSKAPYTVSATCAVPYIEKRDSKIKVLAQAKRGQCASFALAMNGSPLSATSSTSFSYIAKSGVVVVSFVGSGGGDGFMFDMNEALDLAFKRLLILPTKPTEDQAVTIQATVENRSSMPSGPFSVTFHWGSADRKNQFKRVSLESLSPRQLKEIQFMAPLPPGSGQMKVFGVIESQGELDTKNNVSSFEFPVAAKIRYKTIVMQVGSYTATIDNEPVQISSPPIQQKNGRVIVPFRFLAESLGATVEWNDTDKMVTFKKGSFIIFLWVGRTYAIVGGSMVQLDAPPVIEGGRTYVPVRFVSEALGANVTWDNKTKTVTVTIKE